MEENVKIQRKPKSAHRLPRANSLNDLQKVKIPRMEFDGEWRASFGHPSRRGAWLVYGESSQGKSTFCCKLMKYAAQFGSFLFVSLEMQEDDLLTVFTCSGLLDTDNDGKLLRGINYITAKDLGDNKLEQLILRLRLHKSPDFVVIDSIDYLDLSYKQYQRLREEFRNKLFILITHGKGLYPERTASQKIKFDASLKLRIQGFMVIPEGRIKDSENKHFVIDYERAQKYWRTEL